MSVPKIKSRVKVKKPQSESDSDDCSEHELFYYANDRVQLMKEVLKLLKPRKIKAIAPDFMKNLDIEEINSVLLEELLGISNKRLKNILNGVNIDDSSSESEDENHSIDVISLDDISDVDFACEEPEKKKKGKKKDKEVVVKTEKLNEKEKLMSVLEILELQARARAIRSQLALENEQKNREGEKRVVENNDSDIEVVVEPSKSEEIVVIDSENENVEGDDNMEREDRVALEKNENEEQKKNVEENKNPEGKTTEVQLIDKVDIRSDTNLNELDKGESINKSQENNVEKKISEGDKDNKKGGGETSYAEDSIIINLDTIEIEEMQ